jgi:DNA helicase-2/ATP-dependent DNA helicase PcrA
MKKFVLKSDDGRKKIDYTIDYDNLLNKSQLDAVYHEKGPALVIAGAGTGKTRTLVYRVARLVESGTDPAKILLLSFTRKSSREMLKRASFLLDERCSRVQGGTFHYYCSQVLHRYTKQIGYPDNFTIIDASDAMDTIHLLRSNLPVDKNKNRFPKKSALYSMFSTSVNKQMPINDVIEEQYPQFLHHLENIETLFDKYDQYKQMNGVMDFDDLLVKTVDLLEQNEQVRLEVASSNHQVMIDEYQDTNALQARLAQLFSSVHGNIMAVGDDAQSIYSFRGADHRNIMQFPKLFPNTRLIKLEENYRSTQRILDLANTILSNAEHKYDKKLYTSNEPGDLPGLVKSANMNDQSRFLTQMILNLREQGFALNEIGILFRNGRDSFDLEVELNRKDIPYVKFGGQKFTEAAHIKDVLAHIRVLVNPMDTIAWNRVLMLLDGIGPKTAQDLFDWIRSADDPYNLDISEAVSERYKHQLKELGNMFRHLHEIRNSVPEVLEVVVQYYEIFCKKQYDDHPKRMKDLETFVDISGTFSNLEKMLEEIALDPIEATAIETEASTNDEPPMILSTIHSAKGLEWKVVFIIQCLDGIIPSGYSVDAPDQLDEELRLLYVAVTRAKEMLFLTYPALFQSGYGDYFTNPSRFLSDIPERELEPWLLMEESEGNSLTESPDEIKKLN